jgi:ABC-type dipeptide/oligopeptide/nickel transport system permease component
MGRYILTRLAAAIPTLIILTLVAFLLNSAAKGDPALNALRAGGQEPTPEAVAEYREKLGLNDPLPMRYVRWVTDAVQGDFGRSFIDQREVSEILGERLVPTLRLGLVAFAFSTMLGIGLGILFGLFANTWIDHSGRVVSLLLASIPSFWLALLLITFVSEKWRLLPVAGYGGFKYMILPVLALSLGPAATLMRFTRSAMIESWRQDFVRTARAKGLKQRTMVFRHALPNALLPIVTLLGLRFGQILAGAIVIESIFAWPGMGSQLIAAISGRDLPVIGAYVLIAGGLFIIVNLLTDVSYAFLDPRIRLDMAGGRS